MNQTILTNDKIIRVKTTVVEEDRIVDFNDIETGVAYDEWFNDAPWDVCDGWEHEFTEARQLNHEGYREAIGYVGWGPNSTDGLIVITDAQVIEWGCVGYRGCSKQVRAESIARAKRKAMIQLVKWYEHGWSYYTAEATYGEYTDSCCGIDCEVYAETVAQECAYNVAALMEDDDYIIVNRPEITPYCKVEALRDQIRRQLDCS